MEVDFRFLEPGEGARLTDSIRTAYGDSYDARWVYDPGEVDRRIADGTYLACVAEDRAGRLLCHSGMSKTCPTDAIGHSGQAVTLPIARGQHLFTRTKKCLMNAAQAQGMAGLYSEATAAHPYSQKANIDLGGYETGFLLGWIPSSVHNDAAEGGGQARQSAALFYTKLNDGHERPIYAPDEHRRIIAATARCAKIRGYIASLPRGTKLRGKTAFHLAVQSEHNTALLTVVAPGEDLLTVVDAERHHLFHHGLDAFYVDLPLEVPQTALSVRPLHGCGLSYAGIFPNTRADGDVIRMQSLHGVDPDRSDISTASDHGIELLDYILKDLHR